MPGFEFVNVIHPSAALGKNVVFGKGILLGAFTYVASGCILGDFCFVHQKAHLGLHNHIGDFASISGGSLLGGRVTIGEFSAITLSVTVHDRLEIGAHTVVGSCSLVTKDLPGHVVAYGQPAKVIRSRQEGEPYLRSG
jgi:acetyltransferase-like isoleucine patch superfamily enzyme